MTLVKKIALAKLLFGLLSFLIIVYDFLNSHESLIIHFSFFTTLANLFMSLFYIYLGIRPTTLNKHKTGLIRSAILGYLIISTLVDAFILHSPNASYWINIVFHKINPTVFFLDWLLTKGEPKIKFKEIAYWFIFPFTYLTYMLVRGSITGWYPYNFLNVRVNGFLSVAIYCLGITIFSIILSAAIVTLGNLREKLNLKLLKS